MVAISWHWVAVMEGEVKVLEGKEAEGAREAGRDQVEELEASSKFITAQRVEGGGRSEEGGCPHLRGRTLRGGGGGGASRRGG